VNQESFHTRAGEAGRVSSGAAVIRAASGASVSDEAFQKLLLRLAAAAGEEPDPQSLIQLFCRSTREFFQASGVYFWRCQGDDLVGEVAEGKMAEGFSGRRLRPAQSAVTRLILARIRLRGNLVRARFWPLP
jgi:hypothetical protein